MTRPAALRVEGLEDRVNPVVAYALSGATLLAFDTASPSVNQTVAVTNVAAGETLVGIDFRPQNGHLYALGVTAAGAGTLYDISVRSGRASPVGATGGVVPTLPMPNPTVATTGFGFDFNPAIDRIRVVTSNGDNFVIDPNVGTVAVNNAPLNGGTIVATATAYTNNQPGATATTLYTVSSSSDQLFLQIPGTGLTTAVGFVNQSGTTLDFTAVNGFDIPTGVNVAANNTPVMAGSAFAALTVGGVSQLYAIDLTSGAATSLGQIGGGAAVGGLAIQNDYGGFPGFVLSSVGPGTATLARFNTSAFGSASGPGMTGIAGGETLVGIDFRPNTGQLYALGVNAGGTGTLYRVDPQTAIVTAVASGGVAITGGLPNPATTQYGFDFNPAVDAIRVVTTLGQSFTINPASGLVTASAPAINGAATAAVAAAYTNSFGQAPGVGGATTLYVLDATTDALLIQAPATSVTTVVAPVTVNGAPLDITAVTAFDIPAAVGSPLPNGSPAVGAGYATVLVGGVARLYRIDLTTGAATELGSSGSPISALALGDAPTGPVRFQTVNLTAAEGTTLNVVLTRTATTGPLTVTVTPVPISATQADFAPGPYTATFADGATTAAFNVELADDVFVEGNEVVFLTITSTTGVIGTFPVTAFLTISDATPPVAPSPNLVVGGSSNGQAQVFVPSGAGQYATTPAATLAPFAGFAGAVRTAGADVNGDGTPDTVLVTGPGTPLRVAVISGADNTTVLVAPFDPFGGNFLGGGYVAAGDLDGDGRAEFVVTPDEGGGPRVSVFSRNPDGTTTVRANFLGIDDGAFRGGARAATGDVNGDGVRDVIVAAGFGGGPRTAIFTGQSVLAGAPARLVNDFFAFPGTDATNLRNGSFVASGDVTGDGFADLIFGGGPGGAPRVFILSGAQVAAGDVAGAQAAPVANFFVAGNANDRGGVRVAVVNADGDARADVAAGSGEGSPAKMRVYLGASFSGGGEPGAFQDLSVFGGAALPGGVFVG